jgi:hypothetical protein
MPRFGAWIARLNACASDGLTSSDSNLRIN